MDLKSICPKVNEIARRELKFAYDSAVRRFNHYTKCHMQDTLDVTMMNDLKGTSRFIRTDQKHDIVFFQHDGRKLWNTSLITTLSNASLNQDLMMKVFCCHFQWRSKTDQIGFVCWGFMTLNNLMVRFLWGRRFGECRAAIPCHCSQVDSGQKW